MKQSSIMEDQQQMERTKRKHFSLRINMFFFFTFLLFSILIIRLAFLQFVEGKALAAEEKNATKHDIPISPIRGNIYDHNGMPIAYTISAESLFYRFEKGQTVKERIQLAKRLEEIFAKFQPKTETPITASDIIKLMDVGIDIDGNKSKKEPSSTFMPRRIKSRISNEEVAYLLEHRDELPGIEIAEESTRQYSSDNVAVQLVGYMRPFNTATHDLDEYKNQGENYLNEEYVGFDGLELMFQDELRGKIGKRTYPVNAKSQIDGQVKITPPEKGHNLFLTLDANVQLAAQRAVEEHVKFLQSRPYSPTDFFSLGNKAVAGYAVAIEVDTGRVMAMASYPDYDPNKWIGGMSFAEYSENQLRYKNGTIGERYADFQDNNERKKHPSSLVPPGSTLKPLSVLVGLNEGLFSPYDTYYDTGEFVYGRDKSEIRNSDKKAYGSINASKAIEVSSNTFMSSMIGNALYMSKNGDPLKIWDSYMKKFGLGITTGSNLPGESSGIIEYFNNKNTSNQAALVMGSFGQSARYTTLQLAQYASMLANHGKRYKPIFVDKITTYNGELIQTVEPTLLDEVKLPDAYWKVIEDGMSKVGIYGFDDAPYKVNRKTGTSQQSIGGKLLDNAVFIAYAPAEKPKLAVAIVVPEGGFGRLGASPIARKIFDAYDQYIGLDGKPKGAPAAAASPAPTPTP